MILGRRRRLHLTVASLPWLLTLALWPMIAKAEDPPTTEPDETEDAEEVDPELLALDDLPPDIPPDDLIPIGVSVLGGRPVPHIAGSADRLTAKDLERFEDDNIEAILSRGTPGVYVRSEDGYGLRPNIGLRGGNSDRSKKVTLLEDGVLFGPAPYSAPAAYYFPLVTRMTGVEVFKGPSALRYGPHTIGGTINLQTRSIPYGHRAGWDMALGMEGYGKAHGHYGYGNDRYGFVVEGVRLRSSGFKKLDGPTHLGDPPNTGFDKMEFMAKGRVSSDPDDVVFHEGRLKFGYARESSNETYLGLTDADFGASPLRRYAGSQLDNMQYDRFQAEISHHVIVQGVFRLSTVAYRHDFSRDWFKLNRFAAGPTLTDVLGDPSGSRRVFYDVLTGAQDSSASGETLMVGNNGRRFASQGIQSRGQWTLPKLGCLEQRLQFGARFHNDSIDRLHTEDPFVMRSRRLVRTSAPQLENVNNTGEAWAVSGFVVDEMAFGRLIITPGVRFEHITTNFDDRLSGAVIKGTQRAFLPGMGALYRVWQSEDESDSMAVLGGIHKGFSPLAPGQGVATPGAAPVQPEESVNAELGARFDTSPVKLEAIGFLSSYNNLTGDCSFSSGCADTAIDTQFNGGSALIGGVEVSARGTVRASDKVTFPYRASYTFTSARFLTAFSSDNPQWGDVAEGDALPYVPAHQLGGTVGVEHKRWGAFNLGLTWLDAMWESADQGTPTAGDRTDAFAMVDAGASFNILKEASLYVKGANLLDSAAITSRRPFGARPNRPRFFYAGVKINLKE